MKKSKGNYEAFCTLSQRTLEDITWSKGEAVQYHRKIDLASPNHTVITDASNEGWSGHFESISASGRWDLSGIDLRINVKELLAVQKYLEALCTEDPTIVPTYSETPCWNTFAPSQKSEAFIHTQNEKDSPNVEETSTDSASLIKESLHHSTFQKTLKSLYFNHGEIYTSQK